jgi:hypothetical protein
VIAVGNAMRRINHELTSSRSTLPFAVLLAIGFCILSALRLIGDSPSIVRSQTALASVLDGPIFHTQLAQNIALFAGAHVLLAIALGSACWLLAKLSTFAWRSQVTEKQWILIWTLGTCSWILVANSALYPWSLLGEPYHELVTTPWSGVTAFQIANIAAVASILLTTTRAMTRMHFSARHLTIAAGVGAVLAGGWLSANSGRDAQAASTATPNIIVIGIDALRHDVPFGGLKDGLTPSLDAFLSESVQFSDAITPLARTFPSWTSILTGKHPHTTGAVINLLPRQMICTGKTLPDHLKELGYKTLYATDEVRFANIDRSYGFDKVLTPPIGASDFLLGSLNDTPLSNLVSNTRFGRVLFPHTYGNRGSAVTYDPRTFVDWFERSLPRDRPLFVATHLTLAHWPYFWASAPQRDLTDTATLQALYAMSVSEVDKQFQMLVDSLERRGLLENAVVVVLSDHGESIGMQVDNPYAQHPSLTGLARLGHGTSVLSPQQYRVVLGMRAFGAARTAAFEPRKISDPVSLIDVAPTIVELVGTAGSDSMDGWSLAPLLQNSHVARQQFAARFRFTESEFNPRGFQPGNTLTESALALIARFYQLDPDTDRIEVRPDRLASIMSDRQYAALRGDQLLAAVPAADAGFRFLFADINGNSVTEWDDQDEPPNVARGELLMAFNDRFGRVLHRQADRREVRAQPCRPPESITDN